MRLSIRDLTVSYSRVPAIHHVNLDLAGGRRVGLLGPNGAGKTTLIKAIAGLVRCETGRIERMGAGDVHGIAYLPQRGMIDWDFPITVRGMVEMGRYGAVGMWRGFTKRDEAIVEEALAATHLTALAHRQINALSGGQQQRAFLARAFAQQAEVYLLDEPFTGLDAGAQAELGVLFRTMAGAGKLVVASHHDLKSVPDLFDDVILLNGELVAFGPVAEVFTPENVARTYETEIFA